MAKLPIYEQQTLPGSVRTSGQEFGAGVAQAAGQLGGMVADIGLQKLSREYTLNRIDDQESLIGWAQESYTAINDTEDISRPETLAKYSAGLKEKAAEIVKNHRGNRESRFQLEAQVNNLVAQYTKSAMGDQIKAQSAKVARVVEQKVNELAISATFAPDKMFDTFTELDRTIDMLGDAMSPQLAAQYKEAGRSKIAQNSISRMLTNGNYTAAKSIMENPEVGKYLDPDSSRRFGIEIAVDEGKAAIEAQRQERDVQNWTTRLGRNLTPEEMIKVRSLPAKKSEMTPSDKIVEYELVTGKPAPQSVIDEMFDIEAAGAGSMFGNSLQGRALSFVTENAVAYSNGMLSPGQARQYEASLAEAYKPVSRTNPVTGQTETFAPTVPNFVQQAAEQGSSFYGGGALTSRGSQGGTMPGQRIELRDSTGRVIGQTTVGADGNWSIKDYNDPSQQPQQSPTAQYSGGATGSWGDYSGGATGSWGDAPQGERDIDNMSLSDLAPYLVGVKAGLGRTVAETPFGVGDAIGNPIYIRAASRAKNLVELVTNASKPETKIADQYRQELKALVNLEPKVFSSELAYHSKIAEIDKELRRKLAEVEKKIDGRVPTTLEERKAALEIRNDVLAVLPEINHPQKKVKTREDFEKLQPGEKFLFGDDPVPKTKGGR